MKEKEWKFWIESENPEENDAPGSYYARLDCFKKLLLIRSCCPDRTILQAKEYIRQSLGSTFLESLNLHLEKLTEEVNSITPLICLLSAGSDPSCQIEVIAREKMQEYRQIAMGQGQEEFARKMMTDALLNGHWLMLQNCHLTVDFCEEIMETLLETCDIHNQFRLWITTEVYDKFPIGLLQMSLKYTNEPPNGIKSSIKRIFSDLSTDTLDYTNHPTWPKLLFSVAFLHSIVQERKNFGAIGWNNQYDFNRADFTSSTQFIMNHLDDLEPKRGICWNTICFMLSEVQYGGKITDDFDRRLLKCFCSIWFSEAIEQPGFEFYPGYGLPSCRTSEEYGKFIELMPFQSSPEVFGLHANTNISYQVNLVNDVFNKIIQIQPKENTGSKKAQTREDIVSALSLEMLEKLPRNYSRTEIKEALVRLGGMQPMNIFLKQEIDRLQTVISLVRTTIQDLNLALEGSIIMSDDLNNTLDDMFDAKVPRRWLKGSWPSSSLGFWFTELLERDDQFRKWCNFGRPKLFWMSGFFNPQGFITAMRQEVTRAHKNWSLDSVVCQNLITRFTKEDIHEAPPEGVYISGLFVEGAGVDRKTGKLVEAKSKVLYEEVPIIYIYAVNSNAGKIVKKTFREIFFIIQVRIQRSMSARYIENQAELSPIILEQWTLKQTLGPVTGSCEE